MSQLRHNEVAQSTEQGPNMNIDCSNMTLTCGWNHLLKHRLLAASSWKWLRGLVLCKWLHVMSASSCDVCLSSVVG